MSENPALGRIRVLAGAAVVLGVFFAVLGGTGDAPVRMWQIYLVNFLLWTGISQAGVVLSAILETTGSSWGKRVQPIAESLVSFLPVSLVLLVLLTLGSRHIFPWVSSVEISEGKKLYLNLPFLYARNLGGLGLLSALSWLFVTKRRRSASGGEALRPKALAVVLLLLYAVVYSIVGFDFVMSLSPHWFSTLMGAYFFITCFYTGLAVVIIMAVFGRWRLFPADFLTDREFHDIGKLTFGFGLFWMSLLWSQYLVIWYGNLPEEYEFLYVRFFAEPWKSLSILMVLFVFVFPFIILMNRRGKTAQPVIGAVGLLILLGSFLHMFILVVPSLSPESVPAGMMEVFITLGFAGLFILSHHFGLKRIPIRDAEPSAEAAAKP